MKVKEIVLGKRYAFEDVLSKGPATPRTAPIRHGECRDIAGNTVILECPGMVLSAAGKIQQAKNPDALVGNGLYELGAVLYRVPACRVVCLSDEWAPRAPDGRIDAPDVHRAGGLTFTSDRLAVTG